jgi:hypothetical protein
MRAIVALLLVASLDGCVATSFTADRFNRLEPEVCLERPTRAWISPRGDELYVLSTRVVAISENFSLWETNSHARALPDQVAVYDASRDGRIERLIPAKDFTPPSGSRELELEPVVPGLGFWVRDAGTRRQLFTSLRTKCTTAEVARPLVLVPLLAVDLAFFPFELAALLIVLG